MVTPALASSWYVKYNVARENGIGFFLFSSQCSLYRLYMFCLFNIASLLVSFLHECISCFLLVVLLQTHVSLFHQVMASPMYFCSLSLRLPKAKLFRYIKSLQEKLFTNFDVHSIQRKIISLDLTVSLRGT